MAKTGQDRRFRTPVKLRVGLDLTVDLAIMGQADKSISRLGPKSDLGRFPMGRFGWRCSLLLLGLLTVSLAGPAMAVCPGNGLMFPQAYVSVMDRNNTTHANAFTLKVDPGNPLSSTGCNATYPGASWQFQLQLENVTDDTKHPFTVRFDNLQIVFKDGQNNQLGTFNITGANFPNWFNDGGHFGDPVGGQFTSQQYLDPGETCIACICADLAGTTTGSLEFNITYTTSKSNYTFAHTEIIELDPDDIPNSDGLKIIGPNMDKELTTSDDGILYPQPTVLTSGVAVNTGALVANQEKDFVANSLSGAQHITAKMTNPTGSAGTELNLYVQQGSAPDPTNCGTATCFESTNLGLSTEVIQRTNPDVSDGDWYIKIKNDGTVSGSADVTVTWGDWPTVNDGSTYNLNLVKDEWYHTKVTVGANAEGIGAEVTNIGLGGDVNLYIADGSNNTWPNDPSTGSLPAIQKSERANQAAEQVINFGATGSWWISIKTLADSTADLTPHFDPITANEPLELKAINLEQNIWDFHKIVIGTGVDELEVELNDLGSGAHDLDIYIRKDSFPDDQGNSLASSTQGAGTVETITLNTPASGTYYVGTKCIVDDSTGNLSYMDYGATGTLKGSVNLNP